MVCLLALSQLQTLLSSLLTTVSIQFYAQIQLTFPPKMHKIASSTTYDSKFFHGSIFPYPASRVGLPLQANRVSPVMLVLCRLLCSIGETSVRTLIRYREGMEQETAPWQLHLSEYE